MLAERRVCHENGVTEAGEVQWVVVKSRPTKMTAKGNKLPDHRLKAGIPAVPRRFRSHGEHGRQGKRRHRDVPTGGRSSPAGGQDSE
jgi:hypothetical protein